jgi:O-antigen/teichoic acid export membrane protein
MDERIATSKRLIHNTVFNVVALLSNAVIAFFLTRFFLAKLGQDRYGVWLLIGGSILHYGPLLNMGLNSAVNRYIPVYLAKKDSQGIQRVINTTLLFYLVLALLLGVVSIVLHYNIGSWFTIEPELVPTAAVLVLVVGLSCALAMPLQLYSAVLSGLQRYDIISSAMLVTLLLRTVLLVVLLSRGYGLLTMGITFGLSEITMRALQFVFVRKLLPQASLSLAYMDFGLLREMLSYGVNTFLYATGAIVIYQASNVVIGIFMGTAEISQFFIASAGILLLSHFLEAFTAAIKPAVSELDARNDQVRVKELSFLTQKYSLLFTIPGVWFLVIMGRDFLQVWVGDEFPDPAVIDAMAVILAILAVGHCLRLAQHSNFLVLVGRGEHKIFGVFTALTAFFCVSASVVSIKAFGWGLHGIAWSNFLPMALISGVILPIYFNWKMRISLLESVRSVWRPALLGSLPAVALISVWKYVAAPNSWFELVGVVVASIAVTLGSGWFLSLEDVERKRLSSLFCVHSSSMNPPRRKQ